MHVEDYLHVLANVNTIKIFKRVFEGEQICFLSAASHNGKVKSYFENNDSTIEFRAFDNRAPTKSTFTRVISLLKKAGDDFLFFKKLLKNCGLDDVIIVSHIYPHSLILLNFLAKFYRNKFVLIMLHGEIEYTLFPQSLSQKVIGAMYKVCLKFKARIINFIFLTKISQQIMTEANVLDSRNIISMELPTFEKIIPLISSSDLSTPIRFGHIGSAGKRKNVDKLYDIASINSDLVKSKKIEFWVVGILEDSIKQHLNANVKNLVNDQINTPLSREKYDSEVANLDYSMFFYGQNDFLLRSSAAFFDAIFYEKPIIAIKNRFFVDMFVVNGEMGYLCEDVDEMNALIEGIVLNRELSLKSYKLFIDNIQAYKKTLSIDNIAADLKDQLKSFGYFS